jgi:histone acetyltransferase (RNA polymerase elongator complex component)
VKHYTIPIFIPQLACPFQCIFCNQKKITGSQHIPDIKDIITKIDLNLSTIPSGSFVEIGFFGGNFTGLPPEEQESYLKAANFYVAEGQVRSIRLSTRPDYISAEILDMLKKYNVTTIELGAQSFDPDVLRLSGRGHKAGDIAAASELIIKYGFKLGLQMMIGLPGDTLQKALFTAEQIIKHGADNTRIYPALVIKDTLLDEFYKSGKYKPLTLDEAVYRSKEVYKLFEQAGVIVIRMGLHPSEELLLGTSLIAGPFHVSFKELVLTELWYELLKPLCNTRESKNIEIIVPPDQINYAVGYKAKNKTMLKEKFKIIKFSACPELKQREIRVIYS